MKLGWTTRFFLTALAVRGVCAQDAASLGADMSWPLRSSSESPNPRYTEYLHGCETFFGREKAAACREHEEERLELNRGQPSGMYHFTETGFELHELPEHVFEMVSEFWETNKESKTKEVYTTGDIHGNYWESPTYNLFLDNTELEGGGFLLEQHIVNSVRSMLEEWTGQRLVATSMFGIREYTNGAILAPHVTRRPLVISALVNVAQDVDEDWPVELVGHDGLVHNVTMAPGDVLLYESHTVILGRVEPLKGHSYADIFVHFEPIGSLDEPIDYDLTLPPYIIENSVEAEEWYEENGHEPYLKALLARDIGESQGHLAAMSNDLEYMEEVLDENEGAVTDVDENGWTPLAEAVRQGDIDMVELLISRAADVNHILGVKGDEGSILWLAHEHLGEEHPIVEILEDHGARYVEPVDYSEDEF